MPTMTARMLTPKLYMLLAGFSVELETDDPIAAEDLRGICFHFYDYIGDGWMMDDPGVAEKILLKRIRALADSLRTRDNTAALERLGGYLRNY